MKSAVYTRVVKFLEMYYFVYNYVQVLVQLDFVAVSGTSFLSVCRRHFLDVSTTRFTSSSGSLTCSAVTV